MGRLDVGGAKKRLYQAIAVESMEREKIHIDAKRNRRAAADQNEGGCRDKDKLGYAVELAVCGYSSDRESEAPIHGLRDRIEEINEKIRDAIRLGIRGPDFNLTPFDVERIVEEWRRSRA